MYVSRENRIHSNTNTFDQSSLEVGYAHDNKPNIQKFDTFVITTRNPIDRMVSWYFSHHPKNKRYIRHNVELYDCFKGINDLVTYGLQRNVNEIDLDDCQIMAQNHMRGISSSSHENLHILRNYKYYTSELLSQAGKKHVYTIRQEHIMHDWLTAAEDIIMKIGLRVNLFMADNDTRQKEEDRLANNEKLGQEGLENACFFLCPEIQLYKRIINKAVNLSGEDKTSSLEDLAKYCPLESLDEKCTYVSY